MEKAARSANLYMVYHASTVPVCMWFATSQKTNNYSYLRTTCWHSTCIGGGGCFLCDPGGMAMGVATVRRNFQYMYTYDRNFQHIYTCDPTQHNLCISTYPHTRHISTSTYPPYSTHIHLTWVLRADNRPQYLWRGCVSVIGNLALDVLLLKNFCKILYIEEISVYLEIKI